MKIEKNSTVSLFFKDVEKGECFEHSGYIYLKTDTLFKADSKHYHNAVSLETGDHYGFDDKDEVIIRKNAKVVI